MQAAVRPAGRRGRALREAGRRDGRDGALRGGRAERGVGADLSAYEHVGERGRARECWKRYLELEPTGTWADIARSHLGD